MKMNREEHALGILAVVFAPLSIPVSLGFLGLGLWTRYTRIAADRAANQVMEYLIESNNTGLRRIVGDKAMDTARQFQKEKRNDIKSSTLRSVTLC
jgi:hypothetical protein